MNLGKKILKIRKDNKMSQDEFAEILNVTRQTISNWENSKNYPDIETLIKISDKFNISLDILLKGDKKMINTIDKQVKDSKKFKLFIIFLISLILIISGFIISTKYIKAEQNKKVEIKYQEIMTNIKMLGFGERDGIGYSSIIEDGITYKVYVKKPEILDPHISATTEWKEEEAIIIDYDGKRVAVTYINENNTTIYCDKKGNLLNKKQVAKNNGIYQKYQERTTKIITRMVELFENIYQ